MSKLTFHLQGGFVADEKRYIAVVVRDEPFNPDKPSPWNVLKNHYKATTLSQNNLAESLDELGCHEDLATVQALAIGESLPLGFPQGSYNGVIITRIG